MRSLIFALLFLPFVLSSQANYSNNTEEFGEVYFAAEEMPYFKECDHPLASSKGYRYECTNTKIKLKVRELLGDQFSEGYLNLKMTIDKDGSLVGIKILNDLANNDRSAAISNMQQQLMSDFTYSPALNKGKRVASSYTLKVYMGPGEG